MARETQMQRSGYGLMTPALLTVLLSLPSCATSERQVRVGTVPGDYGSSSDLRVGDVAPDFRFLDGEGNPTRFSAVRGRVTALVFPDNQDEWPVPAMYRRNVELARQLGHLDTPVVIVDVGRPKRSIQEIQDVLEAAPVQSNQLVLLADPEGRVHRLFGSTASGRFYVIDNFQRIVAVGECKDADAIRESLRKTVLRLADEDSRFAAGGG